MVTNEFRLRLNDTDTIFERFDEEIIAVQLATGAYHSITGAGVDAFLLLLFEPTADEITAALAEKYEASPIVIEQDVAQFLELLREHSLIATRPANGPSDNRPSLPHSGPRVRYAPPVVQLFRDLEGLFLIDPVHEVGPQGWPQLTAGETPVQDLRYQLKSSASMIFERFDEETVAMNLATGTYYSLTGAGEDIFLLLGEEPGTDEIVRALATKYAASEQELFQATDGFLGALIRVGLVEQRIVERSPEAPGMRDLGLAKPGIGMPFQMPDLTSFRDHSGPATLLGDDPRVRSRLEYSRRRFRVPAAQVLFRMAGSKAVLIGLEKGHYYLLNGSAATVWQLLQQAPTSTELVDALERIYNVNRRELIAALLILLNNLSREGLVESEQAGSGSCRLAIDRFGAPQHYEPFAVEAFRDLRHLFLPFPGTRSDKSETASDSRELISLLARYHEEVSRSAGLTEEVFKIAGQKVRIRCAGSIRASEIGLAFNHLQTDLGSDCPADFTIQVWDCVSGGAPLHPFLATYLRDLHENWVTRCECRGEVRAFHSPQIPVLYHAGPDLLSVVDITRRTAYFLKRDDSTLPYWEFGSPFRTILHFWLSTQGMQFVHGGAVGNASGGILLVGKGGAGKSTTALACLNGGMAYAGDDYCAVELQDAPYLHSVYSSGKLKGPRDLDRFPALRDYVWNPDCFAKNNGDKATFFLSRWCPRGMSSGFPLRAILVPLVTGERDTHLGECSEAQALLAISASTIAQLPMAGSRDLGRLGDLVARLPRYMLYLGTDLAQIPAAVQSVL
jgi:Coenzyme PQQ synthesis protein D (PqqD)